MAHPLRRPLLSSSNLHPFHRIYTPQQRQFHALSPQLAIARGSNVQVQNPRKQGERSVRITAKEQGMMASDLGLLPDTIIRPTGSNRPSIFRAPREVLKLEYAYLRFRAISILQLLAYKWTSAKPRVKLSRRTVISTAVGLHSSMYSAFASADLRNLRRICADGLLESFESRIRVRPKDEVWSWELVKMNKSPRVVSHRGASLGAEGMGIRQAVVRLSSTQRLTRWKGGQVVKGSGGEKDVVEYVVIQRRMMEGREEDWAVWGTTEETTVDMLEEAEMRKKEMGY